MKITEAVYTNSWAAPKLLLIHKKETIAVIQLESILYPTIPLDTLIDDFIIGEITDRNIKVGIPVWRRKIKSAIMNMVRKYNSIAHKVKR
jgi:SLT domain-containing protein